MYTVPNNSLFYYHSGYLKTPNIKWHQLNRPQNNHAWTLTMVKIKFNKRVKVNQNKMADQMLRIISCIGIFLFSDRRNRKWEEVRGFSNGMEVWMWHSSTGIKKNNSQIKAQVLLLLKEVVQDVLPDKVRI